MHSIRGIRGERGWGKEGKEEERRGIDLNASGDVVRGPIGSLPESMDCHKT